MTTLNSTELGKALTELCLDCTRYDASDQLARLLAIVSLTPYLALLQVASVTYSRRQLHDAWTLAGMIVCAAVAKCLKAAIRHSRPASLCERLGNCHEYGMPSSHTQLIFFASVTYMLLITRAPASSLTAVRWQRAFHVAQGSGLGLLAVAVAYSRIYLGYHTFSQVFAGALIGSALAVVWIWLVHRWLAQAVFPALQQWPIVKALGFKDVWRENPDEILYKEREWYELRGARKRTE